jgi:hypothetical protein
MDRVNELTLSGVRTVAALLFLLTSLYAQASQFTIKFHEGYYPYNAKLGKDSTDNKYLALVEIFKDGKQIATARGSTIPDAFLFYSGWFDKGGTASPVDADIEQLEQKITDQVTQLRHGTFADIADILRVLHEIPVLWSGRYAFRMGIHRALDCYADPAQATIPITGPIFGKYKCHGVPRVPRLTGNPKLSAPYDARTMAVDQATTTGGYIATINSNQTQSHKHVATGINIHDGRVSLELRDSEGCLTIRPSDWSTFYSALPTPNEWDAAGHTGVVEIERLPAPKDRVLRPLPPTNVRIQ